LIQKEMNMASRYIAYGLGKQAALDKVALSSRVLNALTNPLTARVVGGTALGAMGGAVGGGEEHRGLGAVTGGALGGLSALAGGKVKTKNLETLMGSPVGSPRLNAISPRLNTALTDAGFSNAQSQAVQALGGAPRGAIAGLAGGLGTQAIMPDREPTWQEKLKGLPGRAYEGLSGLLG
jgi:hypothetical protein